MMNNPYNRYIEQGVMTASPIDLVIMLYDGCIKNLKLAKMHHEEGKQEEVKQCVLKAQDIITELVMSLNLNYEIAKQLMSLYEFMLLSMIRFLGDKNIDHIMPLIDMLSELRDTWMQVAKANRSSQYIVEE